MSSPHHFRKKKRRAHCAQHSIDALALFSKCASVLLECCSQYLLSLLFFFPLFLHTFSFTLLLCVTSKYALTHFEKRVNAPFGCCAQCILSLSLLSPLLSRQKDVCGADRSPTVFPDRRTYADGRRRSPYSRHHRHVSVVLFFSQYRFMSFFLIFHLSVFSRVGVHMGLPRGHQVCVSSCPLCDFF